MSRQNNKKPNASVNDQRNGVGTPRTPAPRARSAGPSRVRRSQSDLAKPPNEPTSLEEFGYRFAGGKLLRIDDNGPFQFYVHPNNSDNQRRYNSIGKLVDQAIYQLLEDVCRLRRIKIPIDAKTSEPTSFFFASENFQTARYLMIIIHGSGSVRAGQWSRSLIMNENIEIGSQVNYIQRALENDYAVIVTNTNLNTDENSKSLFNGGGRRIRGSGSPEEHIRYIWENFIQKSPARHICIMAHSYGGAVIVELAVKYQNEFDKRVFAVALSDSPMRAYAKHCKKDVLEMLKKRTINWIAHTEPVNKYLDIGNYGEKRSAGHIEHAWTSYTAFDHVFEFFKERRQKIEQSKN